MLTKTMTNELIDIAKNSLWRIPLVNGNYTESDTYKWARNQGEEGCEIGYELGYSDGKVAITRMVLDALGISYT